MKEVEQILKTLKCQWPVDTPVSQVYGRTVIKIPQETIDATITLIENLEKLSVTNIMIDVTPGIDGMGQEIYAKTVQDVENVMDNMSYRLQELEK